MFSTAICSCPIVNGSDNLKRLLCRDIDAISRHLLQGTKTAHYNSVKKKERPIHEDYICGQIFTSKSMYKSCKLSLCPNYNLSISGPGNNFKQISSNVTIKWNQTVFMKPRDDVKSAITFFLIVKGCQTKSEVPTLAYHAITTSFWSSYYFNYHSSMLYNHRWP